MAYPTNTTSAVSNFKSIIGAGHSACGSGRNTMTSEQRIMTPATI